MRQLTILLTFYLMTSSCFCQATIFGQYVNQDGAYRSLDLRPDSTYFYNFGDRCGGTYKDTGVYFILADTIFLQSNDTLQKQSKYLYISHSPTSKTIYWTWELGTLAQIFKSDSILPINRGGRLSDYEALYFENYVKQKGYYSNGNLSFSTENSDKTKVITTYYANGQVKSIWRYYKDLKHGDWYFYRENGQLEKIETYKRGQLKRTKKTSYKSK